VRYEFAWDPIKARSNICKHGVSFEIATGIFGDPLLITVPDASHSDRWVSTGEAKEQLLVVVHTDVETRTNDGEDGTQIRIISARRATPRERRAYRDER